MSDQGFRALGVPFRALGLQKSIFAMFCLCDTLCELSGILDSSRHSFMLGPYSQYTHTHDKCGENYRKKRIYHSRNTT